jgi:hypothetical protein
MQKVKKLLKYLVGVMVIIFAIIGFTVVSAFRLQSMGVLGSEEVDNLMHLLGERLIGLPTGQGSL